MVRRGPGHKQLIWSGVVESKAPSCRRPKGGRQLDTGSSAMGQYIPNPYGVSRGLEPGDVIVHGLEGPGFNREH